MMRVEALEKKVEMTVAQTYLGRLVLVFAQPELWALLVARFVDLLCLWVRL